MLMPDEMFKFDDMLNFDGMLNFDEMLKFDEMFNCDEMLKFDDMHNYMLCSLSTMTVKFMYLVKDTHFDSNLSIRESSMITVRELD